MAKPRVVNHDLFDRLMERSSVPNENGCVLWEQATNQRGYGVFWSEPDLCETAHRAMYRAVHGEITEGLYVLHSCDVRRCVAPDHLRLGTHYDNIQDMVDRNRRKGERHHNARLTNDAVQAIRTSKATPKELAAAYSVSVNTVYDVLRRRTWTHV